jgi:hypothetical protein
MSLIHEHRYIKQQYNTVCDMLMHVCECMKQGNDFDERILVKMAHWHQSMAQMMLSNRGKVDLSKAATYDNKME